MLILSACSAENELALSGNEILFTVEEEPLKPDSANGGATTRATKLTTVSSFKLYAYSGNTAIADGVTYTKSGSSWNPDSKVFWPQTGNVTFYAISPASNSAVSFDTSNKQIKYTAPTAQASQQDVLYAYASSSRPSTNTVDLTFNHANAAFSVSAQLATGCTATVNVSGVKLVNVMPTNTLTVSSGAASASGSSISSDVAINSTTLTTTAVTISSAQLMLPPQSVTAWSGTSALANTYLAVTCKVSENDKYVVGSASANGTVYVPMNKTLTKGQENTVNLVFGTLSDGKRSYGRDENGKQINVPIAEAIDLGLSVKWANINLGANSLYDHGNYYAWGETEIKKEYTWSTYKWYQSGDTNDENKDVICSKYNKTDNLTSLELSDDAANVNWGSQWRMPTITEWQELIDNCTWVWLYYYNSDSIQIGYYKITSNKPGYTDESIILPSGDRRGFTKNAHSTAYSYGNYWSSSIAYSGEVRDGTAIIQSAAGITLFYPYEHYTDYFFARYVGGNIRPVCK